jgi:hypothetical protein
MAPRSEGENPPPPLHVHEKQNLCCFCILLFLSLLALWGIQTIVGEMYKTEKAMLILTQQEVEHLAALRCMLEKKWNMTHRV